MNGRQRVLLSVFLAITALTVLLDNLFPGARAVNYFKFFTILALFLSTLAAGKRCREQATLSWAVFFVVVGDFLINFCSTLPEINYKVKIPGAAGFLAAYLLLIMAGKKNMRIGFGELLAAVPVLAVYIPALSTLRPHIPGPILPGVILFSLVLCLMAWVSACAMFSGYYRAAVSCRMALTGFLILISDITIANLAFNPAYAGQFVPWLKNIVWGTYIPAWTLVALNVAEDRLYR
ncbi:MAG: lysoplasmalogenase [Peptococcaceae bacterium]|nr:lysoplasmalogenase [Peptococcaceae bacterium]